MKTLSLEGIQRVLGKSYAGIPGYAIAAVGLVAGVFIWPKISGILSGLTAGAAAQSNNKGTAGGNAFGTPSATSADQLNGAAGANLFGQQPSAVINSVEAPPGGYTPPNTDSGVPQTTLAQPGSTQSTLSTAPYPGQTSTTSANSPGGSTTSYTPGPGSSGFVSGPVSAPAPAPSSGTSSAGAGQGFVGGPAQEVQFDVVGAGMVPAADQFARRLLNPHATPRHWDNVGGPAHAISHAGRHAAGAAAANGSRSAVVHEDHHPLHRRVVKLPQFVRAVGGPGNFHNEIYRIAAQAGVHPARLYALNPRPSGLIRVA